ncbi:MAG: hypothetical protein ACREX0_13020 [Noviherbaspirillum sp.]
MSTIVIKDLPESVELDRQAMSAIMGGARVGGRQGAFSRAALGRTMIRSDSILHYPHFIRKPAAGDRTRPGASKQE